jgi:GNAT superfamily N-acetyltransferase
VLAPDAALRQASGDRDMALARALFEEYAAWLAVDLCFQGFAQELAGLPGAYAPPSGRLLIAGAPGEAFACIALRPLGEAVGEVKRMYVQPRARGQGWGRRLMEALIGQARTIGYRELKLDTLERMGEARTLYESLGFRRCAAYYHNPLGDTIYMALDLTQEAR